MMRFRGANTKIEYIPFRGGLDLESSSLTKYPGALGFCKNYVAETEGGYARIDGYERYSGQPSPSDAVYYYCSVTFTGTISVGDTITGAVSSATGEVITVGEDYLNITKVTGTFQQEDITVGGATKGSITSALSTAGESSPYLNAVANAAAADVYRSDISAPPGSGPVRGLGLLNGVVYCFRDNAAGTAGAIYKATSSGWSALTLHSELSFDTGVGVISDGDTITQLVSGATATAQRVVHESGTWGSDAAGRLILSNITGAFDATNNLQVGGVTKATSTSLSSQITISPGGSYEATAYNFYGSTDSKRLYGCDGVNRGFEIGNDIYVPISTGMSTDTPTHVRAHKKQLFFSFKGSSQNSGIGTPYKWSAVSGASEIAIGDDITGYLNLPGQALAIFARNLSEQLLGSSVSDFQLDSISDEVGCIAGTAQKLGHAYCLDDRGVVRITPTQEYGNFNLNTISRHVQTLIDEIREVVGCSTVYKSKNQYRLYGSNGRGVCMTITNTGGGIGYAFTSFSYPDNIVCAVSGEDSAGKDVIFLGSDQGMVYQADKGTSFDGDEIEHYIGLPFNYSKSPTTIKSYKRAVVEMTATGYTSLSYYPTFSHGATEVAEHSSLTLTSEGGGGYWDVSSWDQFYYDSEVVSSPSFKIGGNGKNMAITIYGKSAIDSGHRLDGITIHYIPRRSIR